MTKKKPFENAYQFKVTLKEVKPLVWRRILVPETYNLWDLHVAIQDAMGWEDYHLHEFRAPGYNYGQDVSYGIPDEDDIMYERNVKASWRHHIKKIFTEANPRMMYNYDFGDDWIHEVKLEKIVPVDPALEYPVCIAGKNACPPEDCGGPYGYEDFLKAIKNPRHADHETMLEWCGGKFDPAYFNCDEVVFTDPEARLRQLKAAG